MNTDVGEAFQPAGSPGFPARCFETGDWKVARTGRLESLPYIRIRVHPRSSVVKFSSESSMTKVAIVEDNKVIRESLSEFVEADSECEIVCTCATGQEALRLIPKHQPDIVLMDIQLPDVSGIQCTAQLKQQ